MVELFMIEFLKTGFKVFFTKLITRLYAIAAQWDFSWSVSIIISGQWTVNEFLNESFTHLQKTSQRFVFISKFSISFFLFLNPIKRSLRWRGLWINLSIKTPYKILQRNKWQSNIKNAILNFKRGTRLRWLFSSTLNPLMFDGNKIWQILK